MNQLVVYEATFKHWTSQDIVPKFWLCCNKRLNLNVLLLAELDNREKFEKAAKQKNFLLFKKDPNILLDINTMIDPYYLK